MNPQNLNSHLTAKQRDSPSLPVRMLFERGLLQGSILDYGCGYGRDVEFLRVKGFDAKGYDPHHQPEQPTRKFDTILCFYVLNVLLPDEQTAVIMDVTRLLKSSGRAYFVVRRDIKHDGFRNHYLYAKPVYQCSVTLPFKSIFLNENTEFYEYKPFNKLSHDSAKCPFCNPNPKLELLTETTLSYAVLDGYAVSKGHTLVIPKKHTPNLFDLTLAEQNDCWLIVNNIQQRLTKHHSPDGFTVGVNIGTAAGQRWEHAAIHIIPRYKGDVINPAGGIRNILKR